MPTVNTNFARNVLLPSNIVGSSENVVMPSTNNTGNTFASANGSLRLPNYPSSYPTSITSWTVFSGISGVYRAVRGTMLLENYDHLRVYDGAGIDGSILLDGTGTDEFNFVSGVGQTFTIAFRSDVSGAFANGPPLAVTGYLTSNSLNEIGEIRNDNGFPLARDSAGTFLLRQANLGAADVQVFTSNGTWTKPSTASAVRVILIGGGGGGGSGKKDSSASVRGGGGGGGGGAVVLYPTMPISLFGATEPVVVGSGGAGGTAVIVDPTNGNVGSTGGTSSFSSGPTLLNAFGGNGGNGGTTTGGTGGIGGKGDFGDSSNGGLGGYSINGSPGSIGSTFMPGGGGGGAGYSTTTSFNAGSGGNVGLPQTFVGTYTNAGQSGASAGTSWTSINGGGGIGQVQYRPKGGGGGGGGLTVGGNGGTGGLYGGGGGGGAVTNTADSVTPSGAGGAGGTGIVIIISW